MALDSQTIVVVEEPQFGELRLEDRNLFYLPANSSAVDSFSFAAQLITGELIEFSGVGSQPGLSLTFAYEEKRKDGEKGSTPDVPDPDFTSLLHNAPLFYLR